MGIVDGIDVSDNILNDAHAGIAERVRKEQTTFNKKLIGECAIQRVYIIRNDNREEEDRFWKEDELPFFFFCCVQCSGDKYSFLQDRTAFERMINQRNEVNVMTYLTYDNTDLFIVIRALTYRSGAEIINDLHQNTELWGQKNGDCVLKNSFSVMAIRYSWFEAIDSGAGQNLNRQKIDKVYIKLIERQKGNIAKIEDKIKNDIAHVDCSRVPILGTDDEMLILSDIGWADFLSLYVRGKGVFGDKSENSVFCKNAVGVTTLLYVKLSEEKISENSEETQGGQISELDQKYNDQIDMIKQKIEKFDQDGCENNFEFTNELHVILNALPKFSGRVFNDYIFFPLLNVLNTLLDLLDEQNKEGYRIDKKPFYDFLMAFCLYSQSTNLSDRHTAQTMGFNSKIYDIPVKLNAFYNAYIYKIKTILNNRNYVQYDFIAVPGMKDFLKVNELYKDVSESQRLIKVEIPEYSFYDVRKMMIILAHETAHYVGRDIRNRTDRMKRVISCYSHVYVRNIKEYCELYEYGENIWQEIERRLENMISRQLQCEFDAVFLRTIRYNGIDEKESEDIAKRNRAHIDYFMYLNTKIHVAMMDIVEYRLSTLFAPLMVEIEQGKDEETMAQIKAASLRFVTVPKEDATVVASHIVLDLLMKLYEESFADLMSILILNLDAEEYVTGIIKSAEYQNVNIEELINSDFMLRIAAVFSCIVLKCRNMGNDRGITESWIQKLNCIDNREKQWTRVVQEALWLSCRDIFTEYDDISYEKNVFLAFIKDNVILENAAEYLKLCVSKFYETFEGTQNNYENRKDNIRDTERLQARQDIDTVRRMFGVFSDEIGYSGEKQICEMLKFIEEYRREILCKMDK